ncbi:chitin disaccharide deacetylase [Amphibacillus sediminis]|uniref:chitin disaccharide deacetylase n=1 Tax=Amphibacillus sediminis TaxID=360185 RepID=UPI00083580F6|nr:chitin disaccharide deacetylase [Amphibacillus sediminis]
MKRIIINADDFGYSRSVNFGIIDAHVEGVLTSTTLMTNMPGAEHAYQLAKAHPDLGVGVHLTLTCGKPLLDSHHTLVDAEGQFKKLYHYKQLFHVDQEELYNEWKTQIEAFFNAGLQPTHLDSHHHVNNLEPVLPVFKRLAKEYGLPVRHNFPNPKDDGLVSTDYFEYNPEILIAQPETIIAQYQAYQTIEVMCHPAYLDKSVMTGSSYATPRLEELDMLMHPNTKEKLQHSENFELITYRDL